MCAFFIQGVPTKKEEPLEISTAQPHGMLESIRVLFFPRYRERVVTSLLVRPGVKPGF